jgi:hypothetical protein
MDGKIKAPPPAGRMVLAGLEILGIRAARPAGAIATNVNDFKPPTAIHRFGEARSGDDHAGRRLQSTPRTHPPRTPGRGAKRPKSFVGEVMRAAKKAGHRGPTFCRGRRTALSLASRSSARRVVIMARIVRRHAGGVRSGPLSKHVSYLKRDNVTRDGADARMFDAASEDADAKAFAELSATGTIISASPFLRRTRSRWSTCAPLSANL